MTPQLQSWGLNLASRSPAVGRSCPLPPHLLCKPTCVVALVALSVSELDNRERTSVTRRQTAAGAGAEEVTESPGRIPSLGGLIGAPEGNTVVPYSASDRTIPVRQKGSKAVSLDLEVSPLLASCAILGESSW